MKKFNNKKSNSLFIGIIIILVAITSTVYGYNNYNYKKYFDAGLVDLKNENFESSKNDFTKALKFNKNSKEDIDKKLIQVEATATAKQTYEDGIKKFNDGKFIDALSIFQQVASSNKKYYKMAQDKILEVNKAYSNNLIINAKTKSADKNYTEAIKILNTVIDFDKNNQEALKLKNQYISLSQKMKDDEDKKIAEKAKQDAAAKDKIKIATPIPSSPSSNTATPSSSSNTTTAQPTSGEYPKIIYLNNGVHIIENKQQDDGHLGGAFISCTSGFGIQPFGINFTLFTGGLAFYQPVTYKAVFHFTGIDRVYNGVASGDNKFILIPSNVTITTGTTVKIDYQVTYKGKIYNFSDNVTCNIRF